MQPATDLIDAETANRMAEEIRRTGGNEVFFVGKVHEGRVAAVEVVARGNRYSVPAILQIPGPGEVVLHNHPSGELEPSTADMAIASKLGGDSVGFYIVNNDVSSVYAVVALFSKIVSKQVADASLQAVLRPGGALAAALPQLEDRPGQHAMLAAVSDAFNHNEVAVLEAGTGTGKTLAYLLPAVDWALKNKSRVVVSTNTINLQEQILNKDAPALRSVFGDKFQVVLVKGRNNYISLRRVKELEQSLGLLIEDTEQSEAQALIKWAYQTRDGSRSDLSFQPKPELWEKIQSETDNCLRAQCPNFSECFFFKARRAALESTVMVANHHMFFADLSLRSKMDSEEGGLLPAYKKVILDEAHHIEAVATEYFGQQVTRLGLLRALNRISRDTPRGERGSMAVLQKKLFEKENVLPGSVAKEYANILIFEVRPARINVEQAFLQLFESVHMLAREGEADSGNEVRTLRIIGDVYQREEFKELQRTAWAALEALRPLTASATKFLRKVSPFAADLNLFGPLREFASGVERMESYAEAVREVLLADTKNAVRWLETKVSNPRIVRLSTAPVEIASLLAENLYGKHDTVVMTSATLAVAGSMQFLRRRTGLDLVPPERVHEATFPSPFVYEEQAKLFVTDDLPSPDKAGYEEALADALPGLIASSDGRAFVLFTSFRSLERQHRIAAPILAAQGIRCFKQGEMTRDRLLKAFREDTRSVLFGTDSFWEGVDVEGDSLSSVILTRLPFRVPTEPVLVSRAEAIEAAGGRAFTEYTVPLAIIKFRQGFGRLIRSGTDRGVVIVTDKRIVSRPYGRAFMESLPPAPLIVASSKEVEKHVRAFFA